MPFDREAAAKADLESTQIGRGVAFFLAITFGLTLLSVPIIQRLHEAQIKEPNRVASDDPRPLLRGVPRASELRAWETRLEDESVSAQFALPRVQKLLLSAGAGNEQVLIGRQNWLHYAPDVDYATARGFLDPALMRVRARAGDWGEAAVNPDPIRAIVGLRDELRALGVALIVVPTPVKTSVEPETLSARFAPGADAVHNPSWPVFLRRLRENGVNYYDATPLLVARKRALGPQYLRTDTHWTPAAMEAVAAALSAQIETLTRLSPPLAGWNRGAQAVANRGDIELLLKVDETPNYAAQRVEIHPIMRDGALFRPQRGSEITLLGDSFSNMYSSRESFEIADSLDRKGWGEGAGLAEQLAFDLKRPLDSLTNNAGGSHVTRERLAGEWRRNPRRFRNLKVVVWQFAARDLLIGDWKLIPLAKTPQPTP